MIDHDSPYADAPGDDNPFAPLRMPVPPLAIDIPPPAKRTPSRDRLLRALLWGDTHYPYQDDRAVSIVEQIAKDTQPDVLVHMGDGVDAGDLSLKFKQNPDRESTLQDEINLMRFHLARMRLACPDADFFALEGNHEQRLARLLWELEGPSKALAHLTEIRKVLTWPVLLGLDQLRVRWVPMAEQSKTEILPKWIVKHGTVVRTKSAYTAAAEWMKYGKSGSSGHTHRLGMFAHRDHNGNHFWVETGCTCDLNPEYTTDPDWQQGAVFLAFDPTTGAMAIEPIYIHNGLAVFRDTIYQG